MSNHPEQNEIEDGEIVSESETESEEELPMIEEDEDDEDERDTVDDEFGVDELNIAELMTSLMATEDGDTVCSALVNISHQLQTQNKILIKMLSKMNSA